MALNESFSIYTIKMCNKYIYTHMCMCVARKLFYTRHIICDLSILRMRWEMYLSGEKHILIM